MSLRVPPLILVAAALALAACSRVSPPVAQAASQPPPADARVKREIRITGIVQAVHSSKVQVPQIQGSSAA